MKKMNKTEETVLPGGKDTFFSDVLCTWYESNKRDLPWRNTRDPYVLWISEIILQQTRVAQGMDYFLRFTERFPDVASLAAAPEEEVLKYWQGLGYYSRARNLHTAARTIVSCYGGAFPSAYKDVLSLKGIGEYTAAAIVSFAWNEPYPVVDGNVYRVLSRLFAVEEPVDTTKGKKLFARLAGEIMNPLRAGLHNQAVMEFGALQCTPLSPGCENCPLVHACMAYRSASVSRYPVKRQKVKTRNRYFHYFHIIYNTDTYLRRRDTDDIWKGLFEFPLIETDAPADFAALQQTEAFRHLTKGIRNVKMRVGMEGKKHVLSHQVLYATFYVLEVGEEGNGFAAYRKIPLSDMDRYAIPRLIQIYLEKMQGNFVK